MKELEYMRNEIRSKGFLSALQITLRLAQRKPGIGKDELDSIMSSLVCKDIHRIAYTNSYVAALKLKDLYYYNPISQKDPTRKKKIKKKAKAKK